MAFFDKEEPGQCVEVSARSRAWPPSPHLRAQIGACEGRPCGEAGHAVSDSQDTELSWVHRDPGEGPHWSLASGTGGEAGGDQGGGRGE